MSNAISTVLSELHAAGQSRDQMIITLVTADGMSLNAATNAYGKFARETGLQSATVSHKAEALAMLLDTYPVDEWDVKTAAGAVIEIVADFGVAESTARDYTKLHSKALGMDHPVLNPREAMFAYLIEHAEDDYDTLKEGFKAYAKGELGRSVSNINEYWKGYDLHLALVAAAK